jgi:hypothetical protein
VLIDQHRAVSDQEIDQHLGAQQEPKRTCRAVA